MTGFDFAMMNRFFHPPCCHFMQEDGSFSIMPEIATDMLVVGSSTCGYRVLGSLNVRLCASGGAYARAYRSPPRPLRQEPMQLSGVIVGTQS